MVGTPVLGVFGTELEKKPFFKMFMACMTKENKKTKTEKYRKETEACAFLHLSLEPWVTLLSSR